MLGGRTTGAVIVFLTASKFFFLVCCLVFLPVPGLTDAAAVLSDVLESCPARVATSSILPDGVVAFSRLFFSSFSEDGLCWSNYFLDANSSLIVFLMLSNVFCIQGRRDRCICYTIQRLRRPCSPYWKLPLVHRTPMATRRWPWWPTTCSTCWCSNCPIFTRRRSRQKSNRAGRVSRLEISSWNSALSPWDRRSRAFSSRYVLHPYISFHSPLLCLLWDIICAFHPGPTFLPPSSFPAQILNDERTCWDLYQ